MKYIKTFEHFINEKRESAQLREDAKARYHAINEGAIDIQHLKEFGEKFADKVKDDFDPKTAPIKNAVMNLSVVAGNFSSSGRKVWVINNTDKLKPYENLDKWLSLTQKLIKVQEQRFDESAKAMNAIDKGNANGLINMFDNIEKLTEAQYAITAKINDMFAGDLGSTPTPAPLDEHREEAEQFSEDFYVKVEKKLMSNTSNIKALKQMKKSIKYKLSNFDHIH